MPTQEELNRQIPVYEPPGILSDVREITPKVATTFGVGGAVLADAMKAVNQYFVGGYRQPPLLDPNISAFKEAWGINNRPVGATREIPPATVPTATTPVPVTPTIPAVATVAKPHPLSKFKNEYEWLRTLDDEKFKRFVDTHDGIRGSLVPGIGYITTTDPKTGAARIERVIENPSDKAQEPMTLHEAEVAARVIGGVGSREEAREARLDRNFLLKQQLGIREEAGKEAMGLKKSESFYKRLDVLAPVVGVDEAGKPIKAHNIALLDMQDSDIKGWEDVPDLAPAAKKLWDDRERMMIDEITKLKGGEYKAEDINKPGTKTYKFREVLKKKYRDALLNSYKPK